MTRRLPGLLEHQLSLFTLDAATRDREHPAANRRAQTPRLRPTLDPFLIGFLATGVSAAGAGRPSSWFDEAATISASTRSLADLWQLLGHIDAVHGLYYLLMHGWFAVFPVTEFSSRAPSSLAVGVAGAGVVVLTRQLADRSVAVCAGIVFAILPRTTWAGIEARSYALTVVAAVWLTILLVTAVRGARWWPWLLFVPMLTAAIVLNAFLVLMVPVHAAMMCALRPRRLAVVGWLSAAGLGLGLAAPFLLFSRTQFAQVAWLSPLNQNTILDILQNQYFDGSSPFAIGAGFIAAAALALRMFGSPAARIPMGRMVGIAAMWMILPTLALVLYTALAAPIYYPRYLCFTVPGIALLLGVCIAEIARTPVRTVVVLLALTVAAAPNYVLVQRGPYKREGMDYSQIADVIAYHSKPGDCLLLDNTTSWKPGPIRPLLAARPDAYRQLDDVGRGSPATSTDRLWDGFVPVWTIRDRLMRCQVLWTVSEHDRTLSDHDSGIALMPGPRLGSVPVYQVPSAMGFRIVERWQFNLAQITKSIRSAGH